MSGQTLPPVNRDWLIQRLRDILPAHSICVESDMLRGWECDGLSAIRQTPWLVVLPDTVAHVQAIVRLCREHHVPVVARGAGTGLSGGALPHAQGVLLSLAKLKSILDIDPLARTARVQPGVRNLAVSQAVRQHGLYYAPDPSSQIACTLGGNVAENSGGVHCLKYGLTVHNILQVKIVSIDGELITLGSTALDTQGFDLLALITGSEGLLGIVVDITLRLLPIPAHTQLVMAAFDDVERAATTVGDIIAAGIIPAGLEMMDNPAIRAAEAFVHAGYPVDAAAILLCEIDGSQIEVDERIVQVETLLKQGGATLIQRARNDEERTLLWKGRKSAFPAVGRLAPDYYCMDGTIPRRHLPNILHKIKELSINYRLEVANVFHAGDGNLHPLILYDANKEDELARAEAFGADILRLCVEAGGSITGEHGVGVEKIDQMCVQFTNEELSCFHGIKHAFDPLALLNPGKAVPSLHRCAELGAMHVHGGQLPHPELERF